MAKKEIEQLEQRIELLEMQIKELKTVEPDIINQRLKTIEDTLYSAKEILNMKEVCQYLDISQSLLLKRRNLSSGLRKKAGKAQVRIVIIPSQVPNDSCNDEKENSKKE